MDEVVAELRRRFAAHRWVPVTVGMSGAGVWRLEGRPGYFVKVGVSRWELDPEGEAGRLGWLRGRGIPVPEAVEAGWRDGVGWLVMTAVPGRAASEPWPERRRDGVVDALAGLAREVHRLPVADCPFDRRLAVTVPLARERAAAGLVDTDDLDEERAGWSVPRLVAALVDGMPTAEDPVVCHGDFCLPNVLLDPETLAVTGVVDVGRLGVADRHQDLALMARSLASDELNPQFGDGAAERFLRRYGGADGERLAFYRLLDEFL